VLAQAGFDVHFLFRSEYDVVAGNGLFLKSESFGDIHLKPVNAYRDAADMPPCDWLLVAAKTTSNPALAPAIVQAAAPGAKVVLLQNGLGVEDEMRALLPDTLHLLGGICIISVHRKEPGVITHYAYGSVNLGYHSGPVQNEADKRQILEQAQAMFRTAGVDAPVMADLDQARWQKLVMNIPFNGVSVLLNSGTKALMTQPRTRALIRELMEEVIAGAAACGHSLGEDYIDVAWVATDGKPDYTPSMLLDYTERRPLELDAIYAAPLAVAAKAGRPMKKVEMLYQSLCFLDERNRRGA
jgi:2-dehydropantoate 2-reductase